MNRTELTFAILVFIVFSSLRTSAKTIKDTLFTTDGDRIILTYDISRSDDRYIVRFNNQLKKLGRINSEKYKDLSKVAVMFFDRTGDFNKNVSITNMVPKAFMVPSNVNYERSSDGFFIVQDNPSLSFSSRGSSEVIIPIYLAYHTKKGKYILFSKCKGFRLKLSAASLGGRQGYSQTTQQTITSTSELESDNSAAVKVLESVKLARELLGEADKLPFSESLQDEIRFLRIQKREVSDADIMSQINDVLSLYEEKKSSLEDEASAEQSAAQQEAEAEAKREAEAAQAKNDSIAAAQQMETAKEKKRNMWMIIGGVVLAILAFVGNQVFQSLRNSRNQRNMMDMQKNIADKAEAEAKRRARNAVRSTVDRSVASAKREVRDTVRKKTTININGKSKNLSI